MVKMTVDTLYGVVGEVEWQVGSDWQVYGVTKQVWQRTCARYLGG